MEFRKLHPERGELERSDGYDQLSFRQNRTRLLADIYDDEKPPSVTGRQYLEGTVANKCSSTSNWSHQSQVANTKLKLVTPILNHSHQIQIAHTIVNSACFQ